jgi:PAX-interacting protein 1
MEKAKKWNINIVNSMWLMELYLGNINALTQPLEEKYLNFNLLNHFGYDQAYVSDFMEQWKVLIKLPVDKIKEAQLNHNSPLKQLNGSPLKRYHRTLSGSPTNENKKMAKKDETNGSISWSKPQSKIPIVLFTGFYPSEVAQYQRDVTSLGGVIAKQVSQTTHLIVNKIERTAKLLKCISSCDCIVDIKWLIDSKLEGKFRDSSEYAVKNEIFEKHYTCCLKESLDRAKSFAQNKRLFSDIMFYLSPSVAPSYSDLEEMIKSADGIVLTDVPQIQQFYETFHDDRKTGLNSRYVVIGAQNDLCILRPFIEKKIPIYHEELVLSSLLKQKLDANIYKLHIQ